MARLCRDFIPEARSARYSSKTRRSYKDRIRGYKAFQFVFLIAAVLDLFERCGLHRRKFRRLVTLVFCKIDIYIYMYIKKNEVADVAIPPIPIQIPANLKYLYASNLFDVDFNTRSLVFGLEVSDVCISLDFQASAVSLIMQV